MQCLYHFVASDNMKKEFIDGLIVGTIITILLISFMEYARQTRPRLTGFENARSYGCMMLQRQNCKVSTDSIILENFDSDKDGKIDDKDTLFELCKNYFGAETESKCKVICGCPSEQNKECVDSDGGINYYVRGELSGICKPGIPCGVWADNCLNETTLLEYYCDNLNGEQYNCLDGCKDGTCLDKCDNICRNRGFVFGVCKSGSGVIANCNDVITGVGIGQTGDCKLEGTVGGVWKTCCCSSGE